MAGDMGSVLWSGRPPGKGMATHSSVLAWRTPGTGEPGGLTVHEIAELDTAE